MAFNDAGQNQDKLRKGWDSVFGGIGDFLNPIKANRKAIAGGAAIARGVLGGSRNTAPRKPNVSYEIGNVSSSRPSVGNRYANKMQFDEDNYPGNTVLPTGPSQSSLFDDLLGQITSEWGGIDKSRVDYGPLDEALNARLGALNGLRDQTNQNFEKSDVALEGMHKALQDRMNTEGAARYNSIVDTAKNNLQTSAQQSQDNLQKIKAEDAAKRQAMLQSLGIQAAGAQEDSSADLLSQAQGQIAARNDANQTNAEADRGTNLAFNQGMVNSVGQAGVERRADLQNQLQSILGRIGMSEADARAENANARYQLEQNEGDRQYQHWRDNQGFLSDTLGMLQNDALEREKLAMQGSDPRELSGFAGLGQDLINSGYDVPEIQNAMGVLSQVIGSDYRKGIDPNAGYGQTDILMRRLRENGIDPMLAFQLATNYGNLGNTSKYTEMPY